MSMPFEKNNQYRVKRKYPQPLDKQIIGFRGYEGQKDKLKNIPDWQEKLRIYVEKLIKEHGN